MRSLVSKMLMGMGGTGHPCSGVLPPSVSKQGSLTHQRHRVSVRPAARRFWWMHSNGKSDENLWHHPKCFRVMIHLNTNGSGRQKIDGRISWRGKINSEGERRTYWLESRLVFSAADRLWDGIFGSPRRTHIRNGQRRISQSSRSSIKAGAMKSSWRTV